MTIAIALIDPDKCTGCGVCVHSCMSDVIRLEGRLAVIKYLEDCMTCFICMEDCPEECLFVDAGYLHPV